MSTPQGSAPGADDRQGGRAWSSDGGAPEPSREAPSRPDDGADGATTVHRPQDQFRAGSGAGASAPPAGSQAPPTRVEPAYGQQPWSSGQPSWEQPRPPGGPSPWAAGGAADGSGGVWNRPTAGPADGSSGGYGQGAYGPGGYGQSGQSGFGAGQYGQAAPGGYGPGNYEQAGGYGAGQYGQTASGGYGPGNYEQAGGYGAGQFGQAGGYGQQPSWGPPSTAPSAPARKSQGLLIGIVALVVVLALAAVALFVWPRPVKGWGPFKNDVFDSQQMNRDVAQVLGNAAPAGYGLTGVTDVNCPSGQEVTAGSRFTCSLQVDGRQTQLTVEVLDASGEYRVNPPN